MKEEGTGKLLKLDLNLLDQAAHGLRRAGTFGNPGIGLFKINHHVLVFFERIVSAQDFKETTITAETLISGHNTVKRAIFRAFAAESDNNHGVWGIRWI